MNRQIVIRNPQNTQELLERNLMLQESSRPKNPAFPITQEYPLVLNEPQKEFSYCAFADQHIVAHANLWPRILVSSDGSKKIPIGLIGNVATHPNWRSRGLSKSILNQLSFHAENKGMVCLLLWSDLHQFYQKLGFTSCAQELRYQLLREDWQSYGKKDSIFGLEKSPTSLSDNDLYSMLSLRPKTAWTIERSADDFRKLLTIPATYLFVGRNERMEICSYALCGKGYDMQGVVHEWGCKDGRELPGYLAQIGEILEFPELILLSPKSWETELDNILVKYNKSVHAMALIKKINLWNFTEDLNTDGLFVWGLDSI